MIISWKIPQFLGILGLWFLAFLANMALVLCGGNRSQDPRLEAAKPKGRGTSDASEKALEATMVTPKPKKKTKALVAKYIEIHSCWKIASDLLWSFWRWRERILLVSVVFFLDFGMLGGFRLKIDHCFEALQERRKLERKVADERATTDFGDFLTTFFWQSCKSNVRNWSFHVW